MSRAKPAGERVARDAYYTPSALAEAICCDLDRVLPEAPLRIIEPSAGDGVFLRAAKATWPKSYRFAVEIDPKRATALSQAGASIVVIGDWLEKAAMFRISGSAGRLILGNPPYRKAVAHVEAGLDALRDGEHLAFLLRLNLLGSASRLGFWKRTPLYAVIPVVPRPSFTGGGSDATEYAVFLWRKGFNGAPRILPPIVWREGRRAA